MNPIESKKCPYCNFLLDKEPGRKKMCINCNKFFYVRINPTDRKRVIVTEEEKDLFDKQWKEMSILLYGSTNNSEYVKNYSYEYKPKIKTKIDYSSINKDRFITIDFETANRNRDSICSMGIAVVENLELVEKNVWLIRPQELKFHRLNVGMHGITKEMVINEPEFDVLWNNIKEYFKNSIVFCHNVSFDIYALKEVLNKYNLPYPYFYYQDSMQIAKIIWDYLPNYRLDTIMQKLNIDFNHHNACDDAICCSEIILKSCKEVKASNIVELLKRLKIDLSVFPPDAYY